MVVNLDERWMKLCGSGSVIWDLRDATTSCYRSEVVDTGSTKLCSMEEVSGGRCVGGEICHIDDGILEWNGDDKKSVLGRGQRGTWWWRLSTRAPNVTTLGRSNRINDDFELIDNSIKEIEEEVEFHTIKRDFISIF